MGAGDAQVRVQDVIAAEAALSTAVARGTKAFLEQASTPILVRCSVRLLYNQAQSQC